jgi:hypothetical protein
MKKVFITPTLQILQEEVEGNELGSISGVQVLGRVTWRLGNRQKDI